MCVVFLVDGSGSVTEGTPGWGTLTLLLPAAPSSVVLVLTVVGGSRGMLPVSLASLSASSTPSCLP